MSESNQLAERPASVKDYLALPAYRDRFHEVMGKRANQFMAAIVASSQLPSLKDAEPRSVIAAAMVAATLDLPVNPTLGQAHIVAYQGVAQFQIGYKGLIQLALRSGQYKRLNSGPVSDGVFTGYDMVGEPILDFTKNDPVAEAAGYYCAFETLNGFTKIVYWSRQQAEAHAKRFSKAYAKGYSTPWKSDFDSMATKTVIKAALGKWGLLSVEMQKAVVHDQGAQGDVDADVQYVDQGEDKDAEPTPAAARPKAPPRAAKGAAAVKQNEAPADPKIIDAEATTVTEPMAAPARAVVDAVVAKAAELSVAPEQSDAAPVETFEQAATATPPPARAFLKDAEEITTVCEVAQVDTMVIISTVGGVKGPQPSVKVALKGGYVGEAYHIGGATKTGEKPSAVAGQPPEAILAPIPAWKVGGNVTVKLRGKMNTNPKVNKMQVFVDGVEPAGAAVVEMEA